MDHVERIEMNNDKNIDDVMLPGFRFHPTDEELVGFYLRRKVQQKPLSIEIIKQLDIYKFDPWDLPKIATTGEKEWYFYCPRDRKYKNSSRPNRVTGAGFWKATGTDRPIYSESSKCIGLKKSLVFYKGRAANGIKTDWMMHEFRLPSVSTKNKYLDKINIPANEAWTICRIFKKANSSTRRALSQYSWVSPKLGNTTISDKTNPYFSINNRHMIGSSNITITNNFRNDDIEQQSSITSFSPSMQQHFPFYYQIENESRQDPWNRNTSYMFGEFGKSSSDNLDFSTTFEGQCDGLMATTVTENVHDQNLRQAEVVIKDQEFVDDQWGMMGTVGYNHNSFQLMSNLLWDSCPCPSELSTSYSTNNYR